MKVGVEALHVAHLADRGYLRRLYHPRAGAVPRFCAVRRPLVAVQLQQRQPEFLADAHNLVQRLVDEHPAHLHLATQRSGDTQRLLHRARARAGLIEHHPHRPRAELHGQLGVLQAGDAAHLDAGGDL